MRRFFPHQLPPVAQGGPILVSFGVAILQLLSVDEQSQSFEVWISLKMIESDGPSVLQILAKLEYSWFDPRLDPGAENVLPLDAATIWVPK